ncbi:unnamed protein product [Bemisia tabaci]|uniref:Uncharacterized protein n=1 Tax=Bemisia tabaci TaxID=7038 RepID=A0A9P0C935_BEMTA|nr:unnamed protein product [Bemisia tabaci]
MKLYPTEEETSESRRNEVPRVPSANQSVDSLQTRQFVHSFGELDLTEENMDFLFLIVYDQSYRRHYVPEFVSRSNDTMVVLCDFFNCGGTTGTDEWFCYGIPGKEISLKDFKNYASLIEESCRKPNLHRRLKPPQNILHSEKRNH